MVSCLLMEMSSIIFSAEFQLEQVSLDFFFVVVSFFCTLFILCENIYFLLLLLSTHFQINEVF